MEIQVDILDSTTHPMAISPTHPLDSPLTRSRSAFLEHGTVFVDCAVELVLILIPLFSHSPNSQLLPGVRHRESPTRMR